MSRHILSLSPEQLTAFALDAFVAHAELLNQHNRETFTTPFPKAPSRWLSHYQFSPQAMAFTSEGDVDGGLSWLVGATIDFTCPCREARAVYSRSVCPLLRRPRRALLRPGQPHHA
jgi:hypothetical protein